MASMRRNTSHHLNFAKQAHREPIRDEATWRGVHACPQLKRQGSQEQPRAAKSQAEAKPAK
ncbi:hypothetical protein BM221_002255 [Beauveria bassiana]|uniref:Uncharacterized protein n=1 Tax=Beauveria bassiana TaxID=176275 RepID=A0A2N6NY03_BEABA|nr:hypothetical protein BM221_002255 [Beauveria bassiana]